MQVAEIRSYLGFGLFRKGRKLRDRISRRDLECEDHVVPGEYTGTQLVVGAYRAAPPDDVDYLVDRLCQWLNLEWLAPMHDEKILPDMKFVYAFFAATLAHLYIAWIHPFGDGNGRTARLLECSVLAHSGVVPWVSSNVLSDFYNRTRSRYYQRLAAASQKRDVMGFIQYSAGGFVDMLREQIDTVRKLERRTAWVNYVHEQMRGETSAKAKDRRRMLVLAMPLDHPIGKRSIRGLTPDLAAEYAGKDDKTVSRDVTQLLRLELISEVGQRLYEPNIRIMDAFLPIATEWAPST